MRLIGLFLGLGGIPLLILYPPLGCSSMIVGGLFVAVGAKREQREVEARRHEQMLRAMQDGRKHP